MTGNATAIPVIDSKAGADQLPPDGASFETRLNCGLCPSGCPACRMEGIDPRRCYAWP